MQLLDAAHFKRNSPVKVADFMNFIEMPEETALTPEESFALIDRDVFGV